MAELIHVKSIAKPVFDTYVSQEYLDRFPGEYKPIAGEDPVTPASEIPAEAQTAALTDGDTYLGTSTQN